MKELDKYAVCKKIIDTDKEKEVSDLVAKLRLLSAAGKSTCENKRVLTAETQNCFQNGTGDGLIKVPQINGKLISFYSVGHVSNFHEFSHNLF